MSSVPGKPYLHCDGCHHKFTIQGKPVTQGCCHTFCSICLESLKQCPVDQKTINQNLPCNEALLSLAVSGDIQATHQDICLPPSDKVYYVSIMDSMIYLASLLKASHQNNSNLSKSMQRKLHVLINCQPLEPEGRYKLIRNGRSVGERCLTEILVKHQDSHSVTACLWSAVRNKGCQFIGPVVQDEALKIILKALEDGTALTRKVLVEYVVQQLKVNYPLQATKTSIGHVIQLLYKASCFNVTKRDNKSSLLQLREEFRVYEALRREHDTQIVTIAQESGLRICPEQWSSLLYGDSLHKPHMQSIIDRLQSPESFRQSIQEFVVTLNKTGDPVRLSQLKPHFERLASIDPTPVEGQDTSLKDVSEILESVTLVTDGLLCFLSPVVSSFEGSEELSSNHLISCHCPQQIPHPTAVGYCHPEAYIPQVPLHPSPTPPSSLLQHNFLQHPQNEITFLMNASPRHEFLPQSMGQGTSLQ